MVLFWLTSATQTLFRRGTMSRYALVHVSDTQFGPRHAFSSPSGIARGIAADVQSLSQKLSFTPLYLLNTGDITETGMPHEFDDAYAQMDLLRSALSIESESVLHVPGNHDMCWPLAKVGREIGSPELKYQNFRNYIDKWKSSPSVVLDGVTVIDDHRYGMRFLLLNSCIKEDDLFHGGAVDPAALLRAIDSGRGRHKSANYLKVALLHHRIDTASPDKTALIENAEEIEAILVTNGFHVVLTGHVHESICQEVKKGGKSIIYSGCGSTGVQASQRRDGVQNQYTIHIVDLSNGTLETKWRAFNPQARTRYGLGGWTRSNTAEDGDNSFELPSTLGPSKWTPSSLRDSNLETKVGIYSNPFTYSNAEKISADLILDLFVFDSTRHQGAIRLSGDAIIRGPRGSGKTMFLRYLHLLGQSQFRHDTRVKRTAECLPVLINLSRIHKADLADSAAAFRAAEQVIFESVLAALQGEVDSTQSPELRQAVFRTKERLDVLRNQAGTLISKLGTSIKEHLRPYFGHILLLIDEIAPLFPKSFFSDRDSGFVAWMNNIRNAGPFCTRVTVYPNDASDILNEERFGTIVNLEYQIRSDEEYTAFRDYSVNVTNRYLRSVSVDPESPVTIGSILEVVPDGSAADALEQLIYASDGSSRRFLSLLDRCLNRRVSGESGEGLSKDAVQSIIKEAAGNLLTGYNLTERELASSISKACRKQSAFRFRFPNESVLLKPLYSAKEEFNIIKVVDSRPGPSGSIYEFSYPYCILMDIQTHFLKETRRVCTSRDRFSGEWISTITTVTRDTLDLFTKQNRLSGEIVELSELCAMLRGDQGNEFVADEVPAGFSCGDAVTFLATEERYAFDLHRLPK